MKVLPEDALRAAVGSWTACSLWTSQGQRLAAPKDAVDVMRLAIEEVSVVSLARKSAGDEPQDFVAPSAGHAACMLVLANLQGRVLSAPGPEAAIWRAFSGNRPVYRGQSVPWHISPTLWRREISCERAVAAMRDYLSLFTTPDDAVELDLLGRPDDDLDLQGLGQHYGMPTPLVDFTFDPLVAMFFALGDHEDRSSIEGFPSQHAVVYATSLFKLNASGKPTWRFPPMPARRLYNQAGLFVNYGPRPADWDAPFSYDNSWSWLEQNCIRVFFPRSYPNAQENSSFRGELLLKPEPFFEQLTEASMRFAQTDLPAELGPMATFVGALVKAPPPWRVKDDGLVFAYTDDEFVAIGGQLEQYLKVAGAAQVGKQIRIDPMLIANLAQHDKRVLTALRQISLLPYGSFRERFSWINDEIQIALEMAEELSRPDRSGRDEHKPASPQ